VFFTGKYSGFTVVTGFVVTVLCFGEGKGELLKKRGFSPLGWLLPYQISENHPYSSFTKEGNPFCIVGRLPLVK
jgi:hypothetical protein